MITISFFAIGKLCMIGRRTPRPGRSGEDIPKVRLRVIDFGRVSALRSQAAWYGVADRLGPNDDPVLTLCEPAEPYVCIGLNQDAALEVDRDFCAANGIAVLRRRLGGGAVLLDARQLIFHFIVPQHAVPRRPEELYPHFIEPVLRTYRDFGIAARYRPLNDIHVDGRKLGGTAAALLGEAAVLGGMFLFDFDGALMARCLRVPSEKFRDKLGAALADYVTSMRRLLGAVPPRGEVAAAFVAHAANRLGLAAAADAARPDERAAIAAEERHLVDPQWLSRIGRKLVPAGVKLAAGVHLTEGCHKAPGGLLRARMLEADGVIVDLELSGDIDCHPAAALMDLARRLRGAPLDDPDLVDWIASLMQRLGVAAPGMSAGDVAAAIAASRHRNRIGTGTAGRRRREPPRRRAVL
jgi:lipoate-protein ligase A